VPQIPGESIPLAIFGKNKPSDAKPFKRDPHKAQRFFEHAQSVADTRNFDYAIDCYLNGLRHDPDNMSKHEALREVALKRKATGGKPAGIAEKFKKGGKGTIDRLLHALLLSTKDPLNPALIVEVMSRAIEADEVETELHIAELAQWSGELAMQANQKRKKPDKNTYIKLRDHFAHIDAFAQAVQACRLALHLDPNNRELQLRLKDLDAERSMQDAGFSETSTDQGGFRKMVKDLKKQRELAQDDSISKSASDLDEIVARRLTEYEQDPQDLDGVKKLVDVLTQKGSDQSEQQAMDVLHDAWEQTGQYRFKMRVGDIRMKQMNRQLRKLKSQQDDNPSDTNLPQQWKILAKKKLRFELTEYAERVQNYPTDLGLQYQLGRRLYATKQYDEAIGAFQQARVDPKHRALSEEYLGRCYMARGWVDEAIDTLRQGIENHPSDDDSTAMALRYQLMLALDKAATDTQSLDLAGEAQKVASQILRTDINYRDIRQRMTDIRTTVDRLRQNP